MSKRKVRRSKDTHIKGIYISSDVLANESRLSGIIELMLQTGLNAVVIDVKDDLGTVNIRRIRNFEQLLHRFHDQGFYLIARVVAFKDGQLARRRPTWAMRRRAGAAGQTGWLDPYSRTVWDQIVNIAASAARLGFDEIQLDQVRFPLRSPSNEEQQPSRPGQVTPAQNIAEFLAYVKKSLESYDIAVSANVYGSAASTKGDLGIGQKWEMIAQHVDTICPMLYPSLYPKGTYSIDRPETQPYKVVQRSLFDAKRRNQALSKRGKTAAAIRPWLQDFSSDTASYGLKEVRSQIRAARHQGIHDFLLWNGYSNYSYEALQQSESSSTALSRVRRSSRSKPFFPKRRG